MGRPPLLHATLKTHRKRQVLHPNIAHQSNESASRCFLMVVTQLFTEEQKKRPRKQGRARPARFQDKNKDRPSVRKWWTAQTGSLSKSHTKETTRQGEQKGRSASWSPPKQEKSGEEAAGRVGDSSQTNARKKDWPQTDQQSEP